MKKKVTSSSKVLTRRRSESSDSAYHSPSFILVWSGRTAEGFDDLVSESHTSEPLTNSQNLRSRVLGTYSHTLLIRVLSPGPRTSQCRPSDFLKA